MVQIILRIYGLWCDLKYCFFLFHVTACIALQKLIHLIYTIPTRNLFELK